MNSHLNLEKLSSEVLNIWEDRVRVEVESAGELLRPTLMDKLPKFLNLLSHALSEPNARGLIEEGSALVKEHAADRARETSFGAAEIVQEFQILRQAVTQGLEKAMRLTSNDYETIQRTFDQTIQEALLEFFRVHTKLREQFTVTLSHDLRNPIGIASMAAEVIRENAERIENPEIRDEIIYFSTRISANMTRADRMIQDLLNASLLKIGEKLPVKIGKFDLMELAENVLAQIEEPDRSRIELYGKPIVGYWDLDGLRRCLENLLSNALKYGAEDLPITVSILPDTSNTTVKVHNHGNPIPPKEQALIFQNFGRSASAIQGGIKGWGIGLAYVRAMTESLGGTIGVESSAENGTTFTMSIPKDCRKNKPSPELTI